MRLKVPDDELGATLMLSLPGIVVHDIDNWSPIRSKREGEGDGSERVDDRDSFALKTGGMVCRKVDALCGSRDNFFCPVCGGE